MSWNFLGSAVETIMEFISFHFLFVLLVQCLRLSVKIIKITFEIYGRYQWKNKNLKFYKSTISAKKIRKKNVVKIDSSIRVKTIVWGFQPSAYCSDNKDDPGKNIYSIHFTNSCISIQKFDKKFNWRVSGSQVCHHAFRLLNKFMILIKCISNVLGQMNWFNVFHVMKSVKFNFENKK